MAAGEAGRGLRAAGALARGRPGRAPPAGRAGGLPRRLPQPQGPPRLLPLRHGRAHHAAPGAPRLRLRRHARLRRAAGARARIRGLPPRGVLRLAAGVHHRRPGKVGEDQGVRRRVRNVQEARAGRHLHRAGAVLHVAPIAHPVRLLQAADGVRVRVREPDGVDEPGEPGGGRGLRGLEQRPRPALLRLRLLQGRRAGRPAPRVAQGQRRAARRHRRAHLRLHHRVQRLPERADRGPLPTVQVGKLLTEIPNQAKKLHDMMCDAITVNHSQYCSCMYVLVQTRVLR